MLILYLPQSHLANGAARLKYPTVGFWWSLFALSWALLLIIPYLVYFLRANGWCAACCGGHQQYHLSSLFTSVLDEDSTSRKATHPGKKRPLLSNGAKMVLHVLMFIVGFSITISSMISFLCYILTTRDPSGGIWTFITFAVGAAYLAVIAFVFVQLRVRDHKRNLVASNPKAISRVLSDSEDVIGRWDPDKKYEALSDAGEAFGANASDSDMLLSDSDTRHILQTTIMDDQEMVARFSLSRINDSAASSLSRSSSLQSAFSLRKTGSQSQMPSYGRGIDTYQYDDEGEMDGLVGAGEEEGAEGGDLDLDENILASQMSGHSPFQLAKLAPDHSCANSIIRSLVVFGFLLLAVLVGVMLTFQMLATYQAISMSLDTHLVPPTGKFYSGSDTYAFRMHWYCSGAASSILTPTVVIETDWTSVSYEWEYVSRALISANSKIRVCRYDRAGYGWSDPGPQPRDAKSAAKELSKVMADAGEIGPVIFVSSGFGTYISRIFTQTVFRQAVAGLVFVDAQHEREEAEFVKALGLSAAQEKKLNEENFANFFRKKFLAPVGVTRLQMRPSKRLGPIEQKKQIAAKGQLAFSDAVLSEFSQMYSTSQNEVIDTRGNGFGDLPLTLVISQYRLNGTCEQNRVPFDKCKFYLNTRDKLGKVPMQLQYDLASLSTDSKIVYADKSAYAHLDQPTFLANAVIDTINRALNISVFSPPPQTPPLGIPTPTM